ncbi:hypothetical protein D918_07129 [Trichuris suis]|nr:hypothetical protein D918_07129 [Trichuris suis]
MAASQPVFFTEGLSVGLNKPLSKEAFGNESKRFDSSESTNKIKIENGHASQVKLILDKLDGTEGCKVYEGGTILNKTACGQNDWNSFACVHQLIDLCEPVGTCRFDVNTSKCTFKFVHFRWNVAHSDFDPCEKPNDCWCDPCANTEWTKWKAEKKTRVIVRYRAMINSTQSDCESEGKFCCRKVIDKCQNGGQLNTRKTRCNCKAGYSGIVCEITPFEGISFIILIASLCLVSLTILVVVFVARCCKIQRNDGFQDGSSQIRSTYWDRRGTRTSTMGSKKSTSSRKKKTSSRGKKQSARDEQAKRKMSEQPTTPSVPRGLGDYEVPKPN